MPDAWPPTSSNSKSPGPATTPCPPQLAPTSRPARRGAIRASACRWYAVPGHRLLVGRAVGRPRFRVRVQVLSLAAGGLWRVELGAEKAEHTGLLLGETCA